MGALYLDRKIAYAHAQWKRQKVEGGVHSERNHDMNEKSKRALIQVLERLFRRPWAFSP
jgi:hypothetical protein